MHRRIDFQELMPDGYDLFVHIYNKIDPTKQVKVNIKGTNLVTEADFEYDLIEIFDPKTIATTTKKILVDNNITSAIYTDVTIWQ